MEEYQSLSNKYILESTKAFFCYSFFKNAYFINKNEENLRHIENKKISRFLQRNLQIAVLESEDFAELNALKDILDDIVKDIEVEKDEICILHNNHKYISFAIFGEKIIYEIYINIFNKPHKNPFFIEGEIIYSNYLRTLNNFKKFEPFEVLINKYTR